MKRLLAVGVCALLLVAVWLLLNGSLQWSQVVLGVLLALLVLLLTSADWPRAIGWRRMWLALRLIAVVMHDIVWANFHVVAVILARRQGSLNPAFMQIPLELQAPFGLAILACIITATPGTVWAGLSPDGTRLTIHVLDLQDEETWVRAIKDRYERPLREIFE